MRKDEKVENKISKIQRDYMRYTQIKISGFRTLILNEGKDGAASARRDRRNALNNNTLRGGTRFDQYSDVFNLGGDFTTRDNKRKTVGARQGSLPFLSNTKTCDDGRKTTKGVGFETTDPLRQSTESLGRRNALKANKSRYNSIDTISNKNKKFKAEQSYLRQRIEDSLRDRSGSERTKERGKLMRELYHKQLNYIFLSNDHRANFYKGQADHIIE